MSATSLRLSREERLEYRLARQSFFHERAEAYFLSATLLYMFSSLQYLPRQLLFGGGAFRPAELWILLGLGFSTIFCIALNRRFRGIHAPKICAALYTVFLLTAITLYSFIYWEQSIVFVFYYGVALILVSVLFPWRTRETPVLAVAFVAAFSIYMGTLILGGYPVSMLSRFHPYFDGLVFLGVCSAMSMTIRHKENKHDIGNFILMRRIEAQTRQFEQELQLADRIHKTLIPESLQSDRADIAVTYLPMHYVGGDYAKFRFIDENRLLIFISDVTGHGVPAALLVNRVHSEFERLVREDPRPGVLLKNLNRFISRDFEGTQMYLSAFCGLLDFEKGKFTYSNYGHPAQFLYCVHSGEAKPMTSHTSFLGILFEEDEHYEGSASFELGDSILLFTDGVIETVGLGGEFFGEHRLIDFLKTRSTLSDEAFNESLVGELNRFSGGRFNDDVFILNVRTKSSAELSVEPVLK